MKRIFLTLAILSTILLITTFALGWSIGDATSRSAEVQSRVSQHFLTALAGLMFAVLVHAICLTYFMGTGRWMEETSEAYHLTNTWQSKCQSLKYRTLPGMTACLILLVATGAFGAAADPASPVGFQGWFGLSAEKIHLLVASTALLINLLVNMMEYQAIRRNMELVEEVLREVRRIRMERGLPVV